MGRGFDDMNHFVLMTSSTRHCLPSAESTEVTDAVPAAMKLFADHRAHWFRSSAVLLHHHKYVSMESFIIATNCGESQKALSTG